MSASQSNSPVEMAYKPVSQPGYDRSKLKGGIVHIGLGNFHRAHQAIYLDRLFETGEGHDWAIIGAGLKPHDTAVRKDLMDQDWVTTIVELDPKGLNARACGSMIDYVDTNPDAVIAAMADPAIRIVSLTITEGGYYVDATTGGFDVGHPEIQYDIANPDDPQTVFGCIIEALRIRRDRGTAPFTVMSCDNLPENGHVAKATVVGLAKAQSAQTGEWVANNVAFPNGMVDCITPATSDRERNLVRSQFGIEDKRPVVCEPFRQWVLEDKFPSGRPALENVGVEFVKDVAPYELMKLRILNGGHAAIAYPAGLLGVQFVHEAMAHPLISGFLRKLVIDEVIPTVPSIPGVDFNRYFESVVERFSNEAIGDTIPRLCLDGSNRQPKFILPALQDRLSAGLPVEGLALEVALWCRYCAGTAQNGDEIFVDDENAQVLQSNALKAKTDPTAFLSMKNIFGDLSENKTAVEEFSNALGTIWDQGVESALENYILGNRS